MLSVRQLASLPQCSRDVRSLRLSIKKLKSQHDFLGTLQQSIDDSISILENEKAKHDGIYSLPNEILSYIFELCFLPDNPWSAVWTVRHVLIPVSQRFHSVAMAAPRLWSYINSLHPLKEVGRCLSRSKAVGLNICLLALPGEPEDCHRFMDMITEHRERWETLDWRMPGGMQRLEVCHHNLHLPRLKQVTYIGTQSEPDFLDVWSMPNVTDLVGVDFSPVQPLPKSITKLKLHWQTSFRTVMVSEVFLTLQASPALKVLDLFFNEGLETIRLDYGTITLTQLTVLDFRLHSPQVDDGVLHVMSALDMPNLIKLTIAFRDELTDGRAFSTFIRSLRTLPKVRTLHLSAPYPVETRSHFQSDLLGELLLKMPALRHVTMDQVDLLPFGHGKHQVPVDSTWHPWSQFPAFTTLRFRKCHAFTASFFYDLIRILRAGPHWSNFEKLEIIRCQDIDASFAEFLRETMDGKTLIWVPHVLGDDSESEAIFR